MIDTIMQIIECCSLISDADPARIEEAEARLKAVGQYLNLAGGASLMRSIVEVTDKHVEKRLTEKGNPYHVKALCNTLWDGIGDWRS